MKLIKSIAPVLILYIFNLFITYCTGVYKYYTTSVILHFLGGFVVAWTFYMLYTNYHKKLKIKVQPTWLLYLVIISASLSVGVVWELHEFIHDLFSSFKYQYGLTDTMYDLMLDILGAGTFVLWILLYKKVFTLHRKSGLTKKA